MKDGVGSRAKPSADDYRVAAEAIARANVGLERGTSKYQAILEFQATMRAEWGPGKYAVRSGLRQPRDTVERLDRELFQGRITWAEYRSQLAGDATRPVDAEMLRTYCSGYEERLESYSAFLQAVIVIATDRYNKSVRERDVDRHVTRMLAKLPLFQEQLGTVTAFLTEIRATSGQGPVRLGKYSHSTAYLLANHVMNIAAKNWSASKQASQRGRHIYPVSASELFCQTHLEGLPIPTDIYALMGLEQALGLKTLRDRESSTHDYDMHSHSVTITTATVNVAAQHASVDARGTPNHGCRQTVDEVVQKAEAFLKNHDYPGLNVMAQICECSPSTVQKAIVRSHKLAHAKAAHELRNAKPSLERRQARTPDWELQVDEALRRLIECAVESERGTLNRPDVRRELASMEPGDLRALVEGAEEKARRRSAATMRACARTGNS